MKTGDAVRDGTSLQRVVAALSVLVMSFSVSPVSAETPPGADLLDREQRVWFDKRGWYGPSREGVSVQIADLTGDRKPDVIATMKPWHPDHDEVRLVIYRQTGTLPMPRTVVRTSIPLSEGVGRLAVGDFNRDGRKDVALNSVSAIHIFLQKDGVLAEQPAVPLPGEHPIRAIRTVDWNRDGRPDLLYEREVPQEHGHSALQPHILRNTRRGWKAMSFVDAPLVMALAVGDATGDGLPDLVATERLVAGFTVFQQTAPRTLLRQTYAGEPAPHVAVADMTGDGRADIVRRSAVPDHSYSGSIEIWDGHANGTLGPPRMYLSHGNEALLTADMNRDGRRDVVSMSSDIAVLEQTSSGAFDPPITYPLPDQEDSASGTAIGDIDSNGRPDVVVASQLFGILMYHQGTGTPPLSLDTEAVSALPNPLEPVRVFSWRMRHPDGTTSSLITPQEFTDPFTSPVAGDWNDDGIDTPGVFHRGWWSLYNTPDASDDPTEFYYGSSGQWLSGDWDGDGADEIGQFSSGSWVLRGTPYQSFTFGLSTDKPVVGDWNGDGKDTAAVLRGDQLIVRGDEHQSPATWSFAGGSGAPIAGDWDGDGDDTLAVLRNGQLFVSNDNAVVASTLSLAGAMPIAGDWSGAGHDQAGTVTRRRPLWFHQGFVRRALHKGIQSGKGAVVADVTGDARPEVIATSESQLGHYERQLTVMTHVGGTLRESATLPLFGGGLPGDDKGLPLVAGDIDGDGDNDVVVATSRALHVYRQTSVATRRGLIGPEYIYTRRPTRLITQVDWHDGPGIDLAVTNEQGVDVVRLVGGATWTHVSDATNVLSLFAGDVDHDGRQNLYLTKGVDLGTIDRTDEGGATSWRRFGYEVEHAATGDATGDGQDELLTNGPPDEDGLATDIVAHRRHTSGAFVPIDTVPTGCVGRMTFGDANDDGASDLISLCGDRIGVHHRQQDGTFGAERRLPNLPSYVPVVADVDGDSHSDIVSIGPGLLVQYGP